MSKVFDDDCPKCFGSGEFPFGTPDGCDCWVKHHQETVAERAAAIQKAMPQIALEEWKTLACECQMALEAAGEKIKDLEKRLDAEESQRMSWADSLMTMREERDHWKANHDHMKEVKRAVLDRPDLAERAALVVKLVEERDALRARCDSAEAAVRHSSDVREQQRLADQVQRLTERLNDLLTGEENQKNKMQLAAYGRDIERLSDEVFVLSRAQTDGMFILRMARRIWRDLRHCIDDLPKEKHDYRQMYRSGLEFYAQFLGKTEDYRNHFESVIYNLEREIERLKAEKNNAGSQASESAHPDAGVQPPHEPDRQA